LKTQSILVLVLLVANASCQLVSSPRLVPSQSVQPQGAPLPDQRTTEVVVRLREALVFARNQISLSNAGRDYLYIGPVETDNSGRQELSLWVGVASTLDREFYRESLPSADELILTTDANTIRLPLIPWVHSLKHSPFTTATPLKVALRAPVTLPQLDQIASSSTLTVEMRSQTAAVQEFYHWRGNWQQWQSIDQDTQVGFTVRVQASK